MRLNAMTGGLLAATLICATAVDAKGGRGNDPPKYDGQYGMVLQALMGPQDTEVTVTLASTDADDFPIPEQLKKIQIKIVDQNDDVVYIVNEKSAAVVVDRVVRLVDGPALHETLYIKALIDTDTRVVVLQGDVEVLLRPDLVFDAVSAPDEVAVDEAFNVDVDIREINGEVGATATVSLYENGALVGAVEGVQVHPGEVTTVVFASLAFDAAGAKEMSVVISGAEPAEYDDTNNERAFTIEVLEDLVVQDTRYSLIYWNEDDYVDILREEGCRSREFWRDNRRDRSRLVLQAYSYLTISGPLDIEWSVASESGVERSGSLSGLLPYSEAFGRSSYSYFDPASGTFLWVISYSSFEYTQLTLQQYSGTVVHVVYLNGDLNTTVHENYGPHINAHSSIAVSIVVSDGEVAVGGTATTPVSLTGSVNDTWSYTAWSSFFCGGYYTVHRELRYQKYEGLSRGLMTPPAAARPVAVAALSGEVRLEGNYPNPSNPATTIEFSLPEPASVKLEIYDVLGRRTATLVDGFQPAGRHKVAFDGSTMSSGTYFYRLTTGGFEETRKLLLLK